MLLLPIFGLCTCSILPASLSLPEAALTPRREAPMHALFLRWAQRQRFLVSSEIRSCPEEGPGHQQLPSSHPVPTHLSLGLCWLKVPQEEAREGPCSGQREDVATACWYGCGGKGASWKHLNCRDTGHGVGACHSVPQWLPRKSSNRCREMAESCCHRALAFPTQSPPHHCWPQSRGGTHIVCLGECRTWVHTGELLLGGQRSWR